MSPRFDLRPADGTDHRFAEALYLETMQPLLRQLGAWRERRIVVRFRRSFKLEQARVITANETDIGWIQVSETRHDVKLKQIHLVEAYRGRGIGTVLIRNLMREAQDKGKGISLAVVRTNPARALYERLGFRAVRVDAIKLYMRWEPGSATGAGDARPAPGLPAS